MGLTDLVRNSLPPDHAAHSDLRRITEATGQAAGLAGQLLALSRTRRTGSRRVDVNHIAYRTIEMLRPTLPPGIALESHLADRACYIQGDETQLQQVLMNLFLNARDAIAAKAGTGLNGVVGNGTGKIQVRTEVAAGLPTGGLGGEQECRLAPGFTWSWRTTVTA